MLFLIDEDVVVAVGTYLAEEHDVRYVTAVLGPGTADADVVAYARSVGAVLVTADRALATKLRQTRQASCLHLRDLGTRELDRVIELHGVIVAAHDDGTEFWMAITADLYSVRR